MRNFLSAGPKSGGGAAVYQNQYELRADALKIKRFARDADWFDYIAANRAGREDALGEFDLIVGPIANDTLYDTMGIMTSGLLEKEQALALLMLGPVYEQTVVKTERAVSALRFIRALPIAQETLAAYRDIVRAEEEQYQEAFAQLLAEII